VAIGTVQASRSHKISNRKIAARVAQTLLATGRAPGNPRLLRFYNGFCLRRRLVSYRREARWTPQNGAAEGGSRPALAAELVGRKVDAIVASGGFLCVLAAKNATSTIPIVFTGVSDPVGSGLVSSLARPDGNLTGFSPFALELLPKRLELISELVPQVGVIALLVNSNEPSGATLTLVSRGGPFR
jgi:hypothetical protein